MSSGLQPGQAPQNPRLYKGPFNLQCISSRYTPQQLQTKILNALLQYESEAEVCHGRRADDGRWYWQCQCLPKPLPAGSADPHHSQLGQGEDSAQPSSRPAQQPEIQFDIEIVQLALKRPGGTGRRRDAQQPERQAYILHFYNKSGQSQAQRPGGAAASISQTQAEQAVQERFRAVTSKVLKLIDL